MKKIVTSILVIAAIASCNEINQAPKGSIVLDDIVIPSIEKSKDDIGFSLDNGVLLFKDSLYSGIVNEYYLDKKLKSTSEYYDGKRHGYYFGWYANGNRWFERFYAKGVKTKTHVGWFENKRTMFQYEFNANGLYDGAIKDWNKNGLLTKHFNFEDGKEAGSQKMWDYDGKIRANFYTVNGERHGLIGLKNCASVVTNEKIMK